MGEVEIYRGRYIRDGEKGRVKGRERENGERGRKGGKSEKKKGSRERERREE